MKPTISAFRWVPPFAQGLVRDLRVRWALNEAGRDYDEYLIGLKDPPSKEYRALQPFGQVPSYQEGDVQLFESGAIVLQIAESCRALLPVEPHARSRAKTWMFAALNTVEPPIQFHAQLELMKVDKSNAIRLAVADAVRKRLTDLAAWLADRSYLEREFTAGDLLMSTVLRILRDTDLLEGYATLQAYQHRCEQRDTFQKALDSQLQTFKAHAPAAQ